MDHAAICVYDLSILARNDSSTWDPQSVFDRLIPRREAHLKRNLVHCSALQVFSRRHTDDAGTIQVKRSQKQAVTSVFDFAIGAKDAALVSVVLQPFSDLSSHVAQTLRRFLEQYPSRFSSIDFVRLRMSPMMTKLLKNHVREYLGPELAMLTMEDGNQDSGGQQQQQQQQSGRHHDNNSLSGGSSNNGNEAARSVTGSSSGHDGGGDINNNNKKSSLVASPT